VAKRPNLVEKLCAGKDASVPCKRYGRFWWKGKLYCLKHLKLEKAKCNA